MYVYSTLNIIFTGGVRIFANPDTGLSSLSDEDMNGILQAQF